MNNYRCNFLFWTKTTRRDQKFTNYFQSKIIIDCNEKIREERLIKRWENFNLPKEEIHKKVYENDLPNGLNVLKNSIEADYTLIN